MTWSEPKSKFYPLPLNDVILGDLWDTISHMLDISVILRDPLAALPREEHQPPITSSIKCAVSSWLDWQLSDRYPCNSRDCRVRAVPDLHGSAKNVQSHAKGLCVDYAVSEMSVVWQLFLSLELVKSTAVRKLRERVEEGLSAPHPIQNPGRLSI